MEIGLNVGRMKNVIFEEFRMMQKFSKNCLGRKFKYSVLLFGL